MKISVKLILILLGKSPNKITDTQMSSKMVNPDENMLKSKHSSTFSLSSKCSYSEGEKLQIKMLLDYFPYNFRYEEISSFSKTPFDINEELLWKDFILCFKWGFSVILGDFYCGKLSNILRELLDIDQEIDVRSSKRLTFQEWMEKYEPLYQKKVTEEQLENAIKNTISSRKQAFKYISDLFNEN